MLKRDFIVCLAESMNALEKYCPVVYNERLLIEKFFDPINEKKFHDLTKGVSMVHYGLDTDHEHAIIIQDYNGNDLFQIIPEIKVIYNYLYDFMANNRYRKNFLKKMLKERFNLNGYEII